MTVKDFAAKNIRRYKNHGILPAVKSISREVTGKGLVKPYIKAKQTWLKNELTNQRDSLRRLQSTDSFLLLVFDAGRYDYLKPILEDQFHTNAYREFSAARDTFEWISTQWIKDVEDVTYITAMSPIGSQKPDFDDDHFNRLYHTDAYTDSMREIVEVWRSHWDTGIAQVPPEKLVDVALEYMDRDKVVVHFSQPHSPFIGIPKLLGHTNNESAKPQQGQPNDRPIWDRVQSGSVSNHYLKMAYQGNATRAVQASKRLVEEWHGGEIVATSDHGEALGEWGMYTHDRAPHPKRRVVPWAPIDGVKSGPEGGVGHASVNEQLEALGYKV